MILTSYGLINVSPVFSYLCTVICDIVASIMKKEHLHDYYSENRITEGNKVEVVDDNSLEIAVCTSLITYIHLTLSLVHQHGHSVVGLKGKGQPTRRK
jgi:spore coat polysaccharide biosynthesis protein SpsF (cytidylyltransferase family)